MTPILVPIHRGVENESWFVSLDGGSESLFLKVLCDDMRAFVDCDATVDASRKAATAGIAPAVVGYVPDIGAIAFEWLATDWRYGKLEDLQNRQIRSAVIASKRAIHEGPRFSRTRTIFQLLQEYREMTERLGAPKPDDYGGLTDNILRIEAAFNAAGFDLRPCHGDGVASNVMIDGSGSVKLVDFEWASNNDPHYDLGAFLLDVEVWDDAIGEAVEMYEGACDQRVFHRCKLHMILDDFMWASWAMMAYRTSARRNIEFFKYGEFRFLRCRYHLRTWNIEEMLRKI